MDKSQEVTLIVGAGVTGLTAGYLLSKAGEKCVIAEKSDEIGGLCRSFVLDNIVFDLGPHLFFDNPSKEAERLMSSLIEDEEVIKRKFSFSICNNDRIWKFPNSIFDLIFYPAEYKKQLLKSILGKKKRPKKGQASTRDEMVDKIGSTCYDREFAPMLEKKTFLSGDQIHRDWVRRVDRDINNNKESFRRLSRIKRISRIVKKVLTTDNYFYPEGGFQVFADKLSKRFNELGGETILECGDISFTKDSNRILSAVIKNTEYPVKNVIWTGSVNDLNSVIGSDAPRAEYVKVMIVLATFSTTKSVPRPFSYIYYPDKDLIFNRIYYPSAIFGNKALGKREGICFELNYTEDLDTLPDEEIINRTLADAVKSKVIGEEEFRQSKIIRLGECLPIYNMSYEERLRKVFKDIHSYNNLYSIGRLGGHFFCMTPKAISQGIKIAKSLTQGKSP